MITKMAGCLLVQGHGLALLPHLVMPANKLRTRRQGSRLYSTLYHLLRNVARTRKTYHEREMESAASRLPMPLSSLLTQLSPHDVYIHHSQTLSQCV